MTRAIQAYERVLASLNKEEAPSILISDFNYFWNKATIHYINERYNLYDTNQQTTDDLSTLVESEILIPIDINLKTTYPLPDDYLHLLRCEVYFSKKVNSNKCVPKRKLSDVPSWMQIDDRYSGNIMVSHTRRDTSEIHSGAEKNYYFKPSLDNPYHFIKSGKKDTEHPENDVRQVLEIRAGNTIGRNPLRDEIISVEIEYLRQPAVITLTRRQIKGEEVSQILEFPDYVVNEIVNKCTILLLEKASDPRLQTVIPTHTTIPAQPAQAVSK